MNNPSELWLRRDHKHDLAFRPLETALQGGKVDAIYTQSKVFQHCRRRRASSRPIEDLSRYPDWTLQMANMPGRHHLHRGDGRGAPRPRGRLHEGHDQGRALGQRAQAGGGGDPQPPDLLPGRGGHLPGHQARRHGAQPVAAEPGLPSRSARTSCSATVTSRTTSTCTSGRRRSSSSRPPTELLQERWKKRRMEKLRRGARPARLRIAARSTEESAHDQDSGGDGPGGEGPGGCVQAKEAKDEVDTGARCSLDVREPEEWQHGHIDGSDRRPPGAPRVLR